MAKKELTEKDLNQELFQSRLSSFAHDSLTPLHGAFIGPEVVKDYLEGKDAHGLRSEAEQLERDGRELYDKHFRVHKEFMVFRADSAPLDPEARTRMLADYKKALSKAGEGVGPYLKRLESFYERNRAKIEPKPAEALRSSVEELKAWRTNFPVNELGTIKVDARPQNLRAFLKEFSGMGFRDRDRNPVKVVLRAKNVGNVSFDRSLLYRSLFNLVTDAYNHTPGRPIYMTLGRDGGHVKIDVTNEGPKLTHEEIEKMGHVRITRAMHDPKRGHGKISTRILTEAMGGTFKADNSRIGPMLTIRLPHKRA